MASTHPHPHFQPLPTPGINTPVSSPSPSSLSRQRGSRGRFVSRVHSAPAPESSTPRRCAACGTTETSQWRSGKDGVSLCNADGIRAARAARAANAAALAAANGPRLPIAKRRRPTAATPLGALLAPFRECRSPSDSYASSFASTLSGMSREGSPQPAVRSQLPPPVAPSAFSSGAATSFPVHQGKVPHFVNPYVPEFVGRGEAAKIMSPISSPNPTNESSKSAPRKCSIENLIN